MERHWFSTLGEQVTKPAVLSLSGSLSLAGQGVAAQSLVALGACGQQLAPAPGPGPAPRLGEDGWRLSVRGALLS